MKIWQTRMQQKHDIPANWEKSNLVPLAGEIIVYDIDPASYETSGVAPAVRYKIGDGVTPVNELPFADTAEISSEIKELSERIDEITTNSGLSTLTPVDGTIVLTDITGGKSIGVAVAPTEGNALITTENGLFVPQLDGGAGVEIIDNKISVKLADTTHGLVAVDGKLTINLATKESDGAMSKEDKITLDTVVEDVKALKEDVAELEDGFQWGLW